MLHRFHLIFWPCSRLFIRLLVFYTVYIPESFSSDLRLHVSDQLRKFVCTSSEVSVPAYLQTGNVEISAARGQSLVIRPVKFHTGLLPSSGINLTPIAPVRLPPDTVRTGRYPIRPSSWYTISYAQTILICLLRHPVPKSVKWLSRRELLNLPRSYQRSPLWKIFKLVFSTEYPP